MKVAFCKANKIVIPDWMLSMCLKQADRHCEWYVEMCVDDAVKEMDINAQTSMHT